MSKPIVKVYSLLTLPEKDIRLALKQSACCIEVASPVAAGNLVADVRNGVHIAVIIDGTFFQSMALPPSEIIDSLRSGMKIYGAASMGALRASETDSHGMIGCGEIYRLIRTTDYFRDDLLGQALDPGTGAALSIPWVDTHFNLQLMVANRELSAAEAELISLAGMAIHFSERTLEKYLMEMRRRHPNDADLMRLTERAFCPSLGSQKKRDAMAVLAQVAFDLQQTDRQNAAISARHKAEGVGRSLAQP